MVALALGASLAVSPAPGQAPPDREADYEWALRTLDGSEISLDRYRGEVLFINLWATWCRPCVAELASIEALRDSLRDEPGVRFLMIAPERERSVRRFLERHPYDLPFYLEAQRMPASYGLRALPTTFIIGRDGRVAFTHRGAADWDSAPARTFLRTLASRSNQP